MVSGEWGMVNAKCVRLPPSKIVGEWGMKMEYYRVDLIEIINLIELVHLGVFFLPAPKTWIRPLFLDFFENRRNYAISMVHNVFQGHLEVAEHVFDIIFMFHHVFDSV